MPTELQSSAESVRPTGHPQLRRAAAVVLAVTTVIAALAYWTSFEEYVHAPKVMLIHTGVSVAGLLWVWSRRHDRVPFVVPRPFVPLGGMILWATVSALWAPDTLLALETAVHWMVAGFAGLLASQLLDNGAQLRRVLSGLSCATVGVTAIGLLQAWDLLSLVPQATPPSATFGNRNLAAEAIVFLLPANLLHLALARQRAALTVATMAIAGSLAFLVFARSRASWLAAGTVILVFLFLGWRHRPALSFLFPTSTRWAAAAALAAAMLLVVAGGNAGAAGRIVDDKVFGRSRIALAHTQESGLGGLARTEVRPVLFLHALHLAAANPVRGVGLAGFGAWFPGSQLEENRHPGTYFDVMYWHHANTHNDWLQVASELGLVGWGLLLSGLWLAWRTVTTTLRDSSPPEQRVIGIATLAFGAGATVNASFAFPFYSAFPVFVLGLMAGAAFAHADTTVAPPGLRLRLPWPMLVAITLTIAGTLAGRNVLLARKETQVGRMLDAARVANHAEVIQFGEASRQWPFSDQLALSYLGRAYDEIGDVTRALACADHYLAREPFSANQKFFRAHCLARMGRTGEAIAEAALAARLARATPRAQLNAARLMEKCGAADAALKLLRALRDTDPMFDLEYGLTALRAGQTDVAAIALDRAAEHPAHRPRRSEILRIVNKLNGAGKSP